MNDELIIEGTTSAVSASNDTEFYVPQGRLYTLHASNLAGAEEVDCFYVNSDGTTTTAQNGDGDIVLTASLQQIQFEGPCRIRVAKDATASSCSVGLTK